MAEFRIDKVEVEGRFLGVLKVKPDYVVENTTSRSAMYPDPVPEMEFIPSLVTIGRQYLERQPIIKQKEAQYFLRIFIELEVSLLHGALTDEFFYRDVESLTRHLNGFTREGFLSSLFCNDSDMDKVLDIRLKVIYILTALQHVVCNMRGEPNRRLTKHLYG